MSLARIAIAASVLLVLRIGASGLTMEWVTIGDPNNVADTEVMTDGTTGYGSVSYAYRIGRFEVTSGQYVEFLNAVAALGDRYGLYNTGMWGDWYGCKIERIGSGTQTSPYVYSVAADRARRPVNYISWGDAARFCNWLTNGQPAGSQEDTTTEDGSYPLHGATGAGELLTVRRSAGARYVVPTEDEWYKAAFYDATSGLYYDYPTGTDTRPSNQLLDPDPGNNANFYDPRRGHTLGAPYWMTEVGEFENSASPYGTFDQAGNVSEWNESRIRQVYRGKRGGSAVSPTSDDERHASYRSYFDPRYGYQLSGFRIVEVPEPTSLTLFVLGGLVVPWRRRQGQAAWRRRSSCPPGGPRTMS